MDALKFIKERNRMCDRAGKAVGKVMESVEKWSKEHPRKTRQRKFLDMFPTASVDDVGVLNVCPAAVDDRYRDGHCGNKTLLSCPDCCREFWMQEAE